MLPLSFPALDAYMGPLANVVDSISPCRGEVTILSNEWYHVGFRNVKPGTPCINKTPRVITAEQILVPESQLKRATQTAKRSEKAAAEKLANKKVSANPPLLPDGNACVMITTSTKTSCGNVVMLTIFRD